MNIEQMIKWMTNREGKVTYSMTNRLGPKSYDCSSAVFFSMIAGGFYLTDRWVTLKRYLQCQELN